jgi:WhiB family redox-sensing transcriptional regulator
MMVPKAEHWSSIAACRALPQEMFFIEQAPDGTSNEKRERVAQAVCRSCRVRMECRQHALDWPEVYGIWGGMTPRQRTAYRRQRPASV